jgi:S1-C subfamily serine protease
MVGVWAVVFLLVWTVVRPDQPGAVLNPQAEPRPVQSRGDLAPDEQATIDVFRDASPSVVYITGIALEYRRSLFSLNLFEIPQGTGSGFIWNDRGYVVTNYHVIAGANSVEVTLADHSVWEAEFVGGEPDKDLAVLKIEAPSERLRPLPVGKSSDLLVGQRVFAIGNPFGLDQTLTTGVVSALGREIKSLTGRPIRDVIQTDAAINPGNSGGPLLDSAGRLIGVNTQIASPSGANVGIGFAVPVDIVNRVVPQIIRNGKVVRPGLGIHAVPDSVARRLDIEGVVVADVVEGSGAEAAGLRGTRVTQSGRLRQLGDVIIKVGEKATGTLYELLDALEEHKVGDRVKVTYLRDGREQQATVTLKSIQ